MDSNDDQVVYVPLRTLCNHLGIAYNAQRQRINRDPVLSEIVKGVIVTITPSSSDGRGGGPQEMVCIPLDFLNGWLFGISASRVKEELQEKVIRYQRHCYQVLAKEFIQTAVSPTPSSSLQHVRDMGLAIVRLAEEQMEFDRRLDKTDTTVQETAVAVDGLQKRMEAIETQTDPSEHITDEQASQISQSVKAVALALGKQSGRNEFGACYGELYRKFGITSYKLMPRSKFDDAMNFLTEWHQTLVGDTPF